MFEGTSTALASPAAKASRSVISLTANPGFRSKNSSKTNRLVPNMANAVKTSGFSITAVTTRLKPLSLPASFLWLHEQSYIMLGPLLHGKYLAQKT
jgi:hypothetical protein